ncbi:MAG: DUF502 domain-containing protein [Tepidisphaeraceae bacterium]
MSHKLRQNFIAGIFVLVPIGVTLWVIVFIANILSGLSGPLVDWFTTSLEHVPAKEVTGQITPFIRAFQYLISVVLSVVVIYLLGWLTNKVLGKKLLQAFDSVMGRIPLVQSIYGMSKQLLQSFQRDPNGVQRVVLIDFPGGSNMKSVALVMKTMTDPATGQELSTVYVPMAPNPTMGFLQILPSDQLTTTDWTVDQAMKFIVTGGTNGPAQIHFSGTKAMETVARVA